MDPAGLALGAGLQVELNSVDSLAHAAGPAVGVFVGLVLDGFDKLALLQALDGLQALALDQRGLVADAHSVAALAHLVHGETGEQVHQLGAQLDEALLLELEEALLGARLHEVGQAVAPLDQPASGRECGNGSVEF